VKTTAWWALEEAKQSGIKHPMDWRWDRIGMWALSLAALALLCWVFTWPVLP